MRRRKVEDRKRDSHDRTRKAHDGDGPQTIGACAKKSIPCRVHDCREERETDDRQAHRGTPGEAMIVAAALQAFRTAASPCPISAIRVAPSMSINSAAEVLSAC